MDKKVFANWWVSLTAVVVIVAIGGYVTIKSPRTSDNDGRVKTDNGASDVRSEVGGGSLVLEKIGDTFSSLPDISKWKTYRNESCGIEVKFPPSYIQQGKSGACQMDDLNRYPTVLSVATRNECESAVPRTFKCQLHTITIDDTMTKVAGDGITITETTLAGLPAEKITFIPERPINGIGKGRQPDSSLEPDAAWILIQASKNGIWYRYQYYFHVDDLQDSEKILAKIISTLKITTDLQSNYRVFQEDGLSFEYPNTWRLETTREGIRKTTTFSSDGNVLLTVSVIPNQNSATLQDWWSEESRSSRYTRTGERMIDGVLSYELTLPETDAGPRYVTIVGEYIYNIQSTNTSQQILNRILYTSQFEQ